MDTLRKNYLILLELDAFQNQVKINDSMIDYLWERREKILNRLEELINERLK